MAKSKKHVGPITKYGPPKRDPEKHPHGHEKSFKFVPSKETKENLDSFHCFLAIQKLKEWRGLLDNPKASEKNKDELRKKLGKVLDIMLGVHKSSKVSDEVVSKTYYAFMEQIKALQAEFCDWQGTRRRNTTARDFIFDKKNDDVRQTIEGFPFKVCSKLFDDYYDPKRLDEYKAAIVLKDFTPAQLAEIFTAGLCGISLARVPKKIKTIYK